MALTILNDNPNSFDGLPEDDEIHGLGGNDTIRGFAGNDLIYGNLGNDLINPSAAAGAGSDTIFGGQGNDTVGDLNAKTNDPRNTGADLVYGNLGDDFLFGGMDNDTLVGGQGNDTLLGGENSGNNLIYGNLGDDLIAGGQGNDADTMFGGQGNDTVNGSVGNDIIYGNLGNDLLRGRQGNDTIFGGQGDDFIIQEADAISDLIFGNLGADTFDFTATNPSGQTTATADRIGDFSSAQGDKIEIKLGFNGVQFQTISSPTIPINSVEAAISLATSPMNVFSSHNVVFVAGTTGGPDGYLLVDQNNDHSFGSSTDFAIVLQGANSTQAVHASDIVPVVDLIFPI